jgi:hypothetical protein
MKNIFGLSVSFVTVILMLVIFATCASRSGRRHHLVDAPDWFCNPTSDPNFIYAVGIAQMPDLGVAQRMAESRARSALALQLGGSIEILRNGIVIIESDAENEPESAQSDAKTISDEETASGKTGEEIAELIVHQWSTVVLRGARIERRHVTEDGTVFVLMSHPVNSLRQSAKSVIESVIEEGTAIDMDAALIAIDAALEQAVGAAFEQAQKSAPGR